jgi:ribosome recycling factor
MQLALFEELQEKMGQRIEGLRREFNQIRTGRASAALLEGIKVDYYGTPTPVNQLASISIPEARTILIQPWDMSIINQIEKAILKSDLGINPNTDGKIIRLNIPMLTEERRKQLAKVVRNTAEEAKISMRNFRREANEQLKELEKRKEITEDDYHNGLKEIQKVTDQFIDKIGLMSQNKEKEIMEV